MKFLEKILGRKVSSETFRVDFTKTAYSMMEQILKSKPTSSNWLSQNLAYDTIEEFSLKFIEASHEIGTRKLQFQKLQAVHLKSKMDEIKNLLQEKDYLQKLHMMSQILYPLPQSMNRP